jgi:hypothetical protein
VPVALPDCRFHQLRALIPAKLPRSHAEGRNFNAVCAYCFHIDSPRCFDTLVHHERTHSQQVALAADDLSPAALSQGLSANWIMPLLLPQALFWPGIALLAGGL